MFNTFRGVNSALLSMYSCGEKWISFSKWTAGNRVLVQISINALKTTGNVLINVQCRFIRLTAVAVEKPFVLINLNDCLCTSSCRMQGPRSVLYFHLRLVSLCSLFYIISNRQFLRKKTKQRIECASWIFANFAWNISYFKKNWRYIMINTFRPFIQHVTCLSNLKGTWFFSTDFREIFKQ